MTDDGIGATLISPLAYAVKGKRINMVRVLLSLDHHPLFIQGPSPWANAWANSSWNQALMDLYHMNGTSLHWLATQRDMENSLLAEISKFPDQINSLSLARQSPLHLAAQCSNIRGVEVLPLAPRYRR